MDITILGGGLSALSLAYYLQDSDNIDKIYIIEKENRLGGLCRSYKLNNICYDIGPHIIFSKDKEVLEEMKSLLSNNCHMKRRSNQIIHKKRFVQYPFENDLSKLPPDDLNYAVNSFINNPYENYKALNMEQFFLKTFGEGITNLYLRPYNEKIWKFAPCCMNTKMVDRIPKPPYEDIIRSSKGETVDGYLHQLYFYYPDNGGMEELVKSYVNKFNNKIEVICGANIRDVKKKDNSFMVMLDDKVITSSKLVSTIPIDIFSNLYSKTPKRVRKNASNLRYNSIMIVMIQVNKDLCGDNFAFYVADSNIIFHRISKVDFLGDNYSDGNNTTYMAEITYRKNDIYDKMSDKDVIVKVIEGLGRINFMDDDTKVIDSSVKRFDYAYVIYDVDYDKNVSSVRKYYLKEDIYLHGRFGNFEYINMDAVIRNSIDLAKRIK